MIDERYDSLCDIFLCYRESSAETAKNIKTYMKNHPKKHYGKVWYSDDEHIGNFKFDIKKHIASSSTIILFLTPDFTNGFLTPDGLVNRHGYDVEELNYTECITVQEIIEIEKNREKHDLKIICVNINQYHFTEEDLNILRSVFEEEGILKKDTIDFYKDLNRNNYLRRQTQLDSFAERILRGLEKSVGNEQPQKQVKEKRERQSIWNFFSKKKHNTVEIITETEYKKAFNELFTMGKYKTVKVFGYTGEVVSNDLITYADRYIDYIELRMLHRNPIVEKVDETQHNDRIKEMGIRPWDKYHAIQRMALDNWSFKLKREIRYYSHQPIIKGTLFCDDLDQPVFGFINAISWVQTPDDGGSEFKSVPSDMIFLSVAKNPHAKDILTRFNQQFEYEWTHGITQDNMRMMIKGANDNNE